VGAPNPARPGHRSRHNLAYWQNTSWHAFGLAAANHMGGRRFTRPRRMADYMAWVAAGCDDSTAEPTDEGEALLETLMLRLRLSDGVELPQLRARFGAPAADALLAALRPHTPRLATLFDELGQPLPASAAQPHRVALTPDGFLVSNRQAAATAHHPRLTPAQPHQRRIRLAAQPAGSAMTTHC